MKKPTYDNDVKSSKFKINKNKSFLISVYQAKMDKKSFHMVDF